MFETIIRPTKETDIEDTMKIYNYEVTHNTSTFDLNEKTKAEWQKWYEQHIRKPYKNYTAEINGKSVGYATLSPYREKQAYISTAELSVYVLADYRNNGIAAMLMEKIIFEAKKDGVIHTIISVITTGNSASVHLHKKFGFAYRGTEHEVAFKLGAFQSTDTYQLML